VAVYGIGASHIRDRKVREAVTSEDPRAAALAISAIDAW
jgi:hypothetical protein